MKKKGMQIALAIIIIVFIVGVGKGFVNQKNKNISQDILKILKDNCNCKNIQLTMFSEGLQFSKKHGFSKERAEYQLTDCEYSSFNNEKEKIYRLLQEKVNDFNLINLNFTSNSEHKTITIRNGKFNVSQN